MQNIRDEMILLDDSLQRPLELENAIPNAGPSVPDSMNNSFVALKHSENHRSEFAELMKTAMLANK